MRVHRSLEPRQPVDAARAKPTSGFCSRRTAACEVIGVEAALTSFPRLRSIASVPPPISSDEPPSNRVILHPGYIKGTYEFRGTVQSQCGAYRFTTSFSGSTTPMSFSLQWSDRGARPGGGGSVAVSGARGTVRFSGVLAKEMRADLAVASATGVSSGSAYLLHSLWTGDWGQILPDQGVEVTATGERVTVTGNIRTPARRRVVVIRDRIVLSVEEAYDPELDDRATRNPELSDHEILRTLDLMDQQSTETAIAKLRATLERACVALDKSTDVHNSVTTVEMTGLA